MKWRWRSKVSVSSVLVWLHSRVEHCIRARADFWETRKKTGTKYELHVYNAVYYGPRYSLPKDAFPTLKMNVIFVFGLRHCRCQSVRRTDQHVCELVQQHGPRCLLQLSTAKSDEKTRRRWKTKYFLEWQYNALDSFVFFFIHCRVTGGQMKLRWSWSWERLKAILPFTTHY